MHKYLFAFLILSSFIFSVRAVPVSPIDTSQTKTDTFIIRQDDPVILAMDRAAQEPFINANHCEVDTATLNEFNFPADSIPRYNDEYYQTELARLDSMTPFNLVYNKRVEAFIRLYTVDRRELTSRMLGLQHFYFPMFEQILDQYDIPIEMKYLAIVESALNPRARSRAGATGLWQFMYSTGKIYGLHQNSYMDERMDPIKSTHAACQYMKRLYSIYERWDLVLAAYNCGPGNVNKAMRRSGSRDGNYWDLYPFLPRETRGYVPAFIAVNYVMNNPSAHNLYPIAPEANFFEVDTIRVKQPIQLEKVADIIGESTAYLSYLNPSYKTGLVPAYSNKTNYLVLPLDKVGQYIQNEALVYKESTKAKENDGNATVQKFEEDRIVYRVQPGDYLGRIAQQHHVSVSNIRRWNGLRSNNIRVGQRLVLYSNGSYRAQQNTTPKVNGKTEAKGDYIYYTIQSGDTLWDIAKAKGVSLNELKRLNSNMDFRKLKPGMKVIVGANS